MPSGVTLRQCRRQALGPISVAGLLVPQSPAMLPSPRPRLLPLLTLVVATLLWPAVARAQDEVVYYHTDAIGSVRMTTDATGAAIDRYDFLPFGEAWDPPTTPDARQFAGQVRDHETFAGSAATGLDYFGARYHQSAIGRFTSVDPVLDAERALADPQRWNRYAYALNRPLTYVDPDGRSPKAGVLLLKVGHALYKGYDVYSTVEELVDAGGTLVSPESTGWERLLAVGTLAGELSGVSDGLRAGRGVLRAVDDARDAGRRYGGLDDLSRAAGAPDRGGLSAAGRQLQKHGGRPGSAFPSARGNPSAISHQGQQVVDDILTTPGATAVRRHHARFGDVSEIRAPDGRGLRYGSDGRFLGFLEPRQ
jgi:RHS repeat-associated protein